VLSVMCYVLCVASVLWIVGCVLCVLFFIFCYHLSHHFVVYSVVIGRVSDRLFVCLTIRVCSFVYIEPGSA
jgi:hypothetical protein